MTNSIYELEYVHGNERHYLEIFSSEGDLVAWFVGEQALKMNVLLGAFPFISERDWFISNRVNQFVNANF